MNMDSLQGVDPITGQVLWMRNDLAKSNHIYNDDQYIYTIEMLAEGVTGATRVFRLHDGVSVPAKDFSDHYTKRLKMFGRTILTADPEGAKVVLRLYDIITGQDRWKGTFAAGSLVLQPECDGLAGVVEPNGKVTIVDLNTLKVVCKDAQMKPEHLAKMHSITLLRDHKDVFIVCNADPDPLVQTNTLQSNLMPGSGLRALPVNGYIYSFDTASGELNWYNNAENQMLVLDEFENVPVVMLTSRYRKWDKPRIQQMYLAAIRSYDKRTGKMIWDKEDPNTTKYQQFHTIKVDARAGYVDLLSYNLRWRHALEGATGAGDGKKGDGKQGRGPGNVPIEEVTVPGGQPGILLPAPPPRVIRKRIEN
jgi:hypothetical protein